MSQQAGGAKPPVYPGQASGDCWADKRHVRDPLEVLGDGPQIGLTRHPLEPVEAGQVDGPAVPTQGQLAFEIEVVLEIRHRQLA
jgi:hypothetical protein